MNEACDWIVLHKNKNMVLRAHVDSTLEGAQEMMQQWVEVLNADPEDVMLYRAYFAPCNFRTVVTLVE
jgi:hypothetical protein